MIKDNQGRIQASEEFSFSTKIEQQGQVQQATHPSIHLPSRRKMLVGGLAVGAALVGGGLLTTWGINTLQRIKNGVVNGQPVFDTAWEGIDFVWLPDSTHLAYASERGLFLVDMRNGQQIWKQKVWPNSNYKYTQTVICSANCTTLAYLAQTALLVQDVQSGQNLWSYQLPQPVSSTGNGQPVSYTAALSPDGLHLAFAYATNDTSVQIWNAQKGQLVSQYNVQASSKNLAGISSIIWSPDARHIAVTGSDGSVQVRDSLEDHVFWSYHDQVSSGPREAINWSPDGSAIAFAASGNDGQTQLGVWDAFSGQTRFLTPANVGYPTDGNKKDNSLAWSPDGTRIAFNTTVHNESLVEVWSVRSGQRLFTCQGTQGQLTGVTWSPDGKYLAAGNSIVGSGELESGDNGDRSVIQFWDAHNGYTLFTYKAPKSPDHLTWSPDSRYLAIITPKSYGILPQTTCLSMCRYGYTNNALQVFQIE